MREVLDERSGVPRAARDDHHARFRSYQLFAEAWAGGAAIQDGASATEAGGALDVEGFFT